MKILPPVRPLTAQASAHTMPGTVQIIKNHFFVFKLEREIRFESSTWPFFSQREIGGGKLLSRTVVCPWVLMINSFIFRWKVAFVELSVERKKCLSTNGLKKKWAPLDWIINIKESKAEECSCFHSVGFSFAVSKEERKKEEKRDTTTNNNKRNETATSTAGLAAMWKPCSRVERNIRSQGEKKWLAVTGAAAVEIVSFSS